jgi:hypothetical protein
MRTGVFAILAAAAAVWGQVEAPERPGRAEGRSQAARSPGAAQSPRRADLPVMRGVVREFPGGHPDVRPGRAAGRHAGIVADQLGDDGAPVFVSRGYRVLRPGCDAGGQAVIGPRRYIERRAGDRAPRVEFVEGAAVESARSLGAWFHDVSGVNRTFVRAVEFRPVGAGGKAHAYVAEVDLAGVSSGQPAGARTLELSGRFVYRRGAGDRLRFASADDLWVFVDGRLVVDLGGSAERELAAGESGGAEEHDAAAKAEDELAAASEQSVELDRLEWLRDGNEYVVKVFCAARSAEAAPPPMRIETTVGFGSRAPALATVDAGGSE